MPSRRTSASTQRRSDRWFPATRRRTANSQGLSLGGGCCSRLPAQAAAPPTGASSPMRCDTRRRGRRPSPLRRRAPASYRRPIGRYATGGSCTDRPSDPRRKPRELLHLRDVDAAPAQNLMDGVDIFDDELCPCSEPGWESTHPSPTAMQHAEPGGVRRTKRRSPSVRHSNSILSSRTTQRLPNFDIRREAYAAHAAVGLLLVVHCDGAVRRDRGYRVCLYASAMSGDHRALGLRSG